VAKAPRDIGASVRARLLNRARERGQVFDLLLTRYALERLLYRLSISKYRNRFVLKGVLLLTIGCRRTLLDNSALCSRATE
jgi:hypothetical protein